MFYETSEGQTHWACNKRLKEEGGKARCCTCVPHEGCQRDIKTVLKREPIKKSEEKKLWMKCIYCYKDMYTASEMQEHAKCHQKEQEYEIRKPMNRIEWDKLNPKEQTVDFLAKGKGSLIPEQDEDINNPTCCPKGWHNNTFVCKTNKEQECALFFDGGKGMFYNPQEQEYEIRKPVDREDWDKFTHKEHECKYHHYKSIPNKLELECIKCGYRNYDETIEALDRTGNKSLEQVPKEWTEEFVVNRSQSKVYCDKHKITDITCEDCNRNFARNCKIDAETARDLSFISDLLDKERECWKKESAILQSWKKLKTDESIVFIKRVEEEAISQYRQYLLDKIPKEKNGTETADKITNKDVRRGMNFFKNGGDERAGFITGYNECREDIISIIK